SRFRDMMPGKPVSSFTSNGLKALIRCSVGKFRFVARKRARRFHKDDRLSDDFVWGAKHPWRSIALSAGGQRKLRKGLSLGRIESRRGSTGRIRKPYIRIWTISWTMSSRYKEK